MTDEIPPMTTTDYRIRGPGDYDAVFVTVTDSQSKGDDDDAPDVADAVCDAIEEAVDDIDDVDLTRKG